jgi:hypothetical protein
MVEARMTEQSWLANQTSNENTPILPKTKQDRIASKQNFQSRAVGQKTLTCGKFSARMPNQIN